MLVVQEAAICWGGVPPPLADQKAVLLAAEQEVARLHEQLAGLDLEAQVVSAADTAPEAHGLEPCAQATSLSLPISPLRVEQLLVAGKPEASRGSLGAEQLLVEETLLPGQAADQAGGV
jgi:hypothetical protein